ncbi:MAG TPA: zinc-binding dehydrogenase [Firmicutes bacterium]|jgi:(R,R)-butanediol dehydrogenase / meso-butanediol dehydrogenase / diacetyl reductase|nr:zinc-binding dehydrogenase [Bacillota bacterium]
MRAIRFDGKCGAELVDIPVPEIEAEEALIKVKYCGICGSDIAIYTGKNPRAKIPVVPGHELVGEIVAIHDSHNSGNKMGDRVAVIPTLTCGVCELCRNGKRHLCKTLKFIGIQTEGGFAEYVKVPVSSLIKIPEQLDYEKAVLVEPLAVAVHAVRLAKVEVGDSVAIIGAGPIGILVALIAKLSGCRVRISEVSDFRVENALKMGLDTIRARQDDPVKRILAETEDRGADLVFECVGHPSTTEQMIEMGRSEAQLIVVGAFKEVPPVDLFRMSRKEQWMTASWTYTAIDFERSMRLLFQNTASFERVISHFMPLEETHQAMEMVKKAEQTMKVVLKI